MAEKFFSNKKTNIRIVIVVLVSIIFSVFLYNFNNFEKSELVNQQGNSFNKAVVQSIVKDNIQEHGSRIGTQKVNLKISSGEFKGKIIEATSNSGYLYGADCTVGMRVIAKISVAKDNITASVYSYDRSFMIYAFVAFFLISIWVIGGKNGFKSAIGLIFTFICIIFLFIPMLYKGYSPFFSAVIIVILTTVVTMYLIGGFTKKTLSAILGTVIGVIFSGIFASVFGHFAKISGYNVSDIEDLVFISSQTDLKIGGLLFAGILIASLGAVMDVSMSIASTINEINEKSPDLTRKELFKSGINVGRDMMGTMSNTLILAFTGGAISTLITFYSYNMHYNQVINMYSIGIEIMQGISGSLAVIYTVPLVSFISAVLLKKK